MRDQARRLNAFHAGLGIYGIMFRCVFGNANNENNNDVLTGTEGRVIVMSVAEPCTDAVLDRAFILGIGVSAMPRAGQ